MRSFACSATTLGASKAHTAGPSVGVRETRGRMSAPILLFATLAAIAPLAVIAKWLKLPYPIVFVIGGSAIAFVPGLPHVNIRPGVDFLHGPAPAALPRRLGDRLGASSRRNVRPVVLLAVGAGHRQHRRRRRDDRMARPGVSAGPARSCWGRSSRPPMPSRPRAVFERFGVPRRILAILDGEGLLNDGSALVIYRFAVFAAVLGQLLAAACFDDVRDRS